MPSQFYIWKHSGHEVGACHYSWCRSFYFFCILTSATRSTQSWVISVVLLAFSFLSVFLSDVWTPPPQNTKEQSIGNHSLVEGAQQQFADVKRKYRLLWPFLYAASMWLYQSSLLSSCTPRYCTCRMKPAPPQFPVRQEDLVWASSSWNQWSFL